MARVRALLLALAAIVAAAPSGPAAARSDPAALCGLHIDWIESSGLVPRGLLHAIALVETARWLPDHQRSRPWPWTVTAGERAYYPPTREAALGMVHRLQAAGRTNIDVGCMQINLRYHGDAFAAFDDPAGALLDPATNVAYAAAFLQRLRAEARSWWQAAGYYHSRDPEAAAAYRAKVGRFWREDQGRSPPPVADSRRRVLADGSADAAARNAPVVARRGSAAATVQELVRLAEEGDSDAQAELAGLYATGDGVPRDDIQALKWYMLAALHGKPARSLPLQETRGGLTPEQVREAEVQALFWTPARRPDPPGPGGNGGHSAGSATISDHPLEPRSALGEVDCGAELNPIRRKLCEVKRRRVDLKTVLINRKHSDHAAAAVHEGQGRYRPVPEEVDCGAEANPIRRKLCEVKTQRARVRPTPDSEVASRVDGPAVEPTPASFEEPR